MWIRAQRRSPIAQNMHMETLVCMEYIDMIFNPENLLTKDVFALLKQDHLTTIKYKMFVYYAITFFWKIMFPHGSGYVACCYADCLVGKDTKDWIVTMKYTFFALPGLRQEIRPVSTTDPYSVGVQARSSS